MDGCTKNPSNSFAKAALFFLFFFATFSFAVAQGKWVLVDKTLESNSKYWKADKNKFYWHNGSIYFLFNDPPATISFGEENNIVIPYTMVHDNIKNRRGDDRPASGAYEMHVELYRTDGTMVFLKNEITEKAHYEGNDDVRKGRWRYSGICNGEDSSKVWQGSTSKIIRVCKVYG